MTACLAKHTDGALEAAPEIDVNALRVLPRPAHLPVSGVGAVGVAVCRSLPLTLYVVRVTCETDEGRNLIERATYVYLPL